MKLAATSPPRRRQVAATDEVREGPPVSRSLGPQRRKTRRAVVALAVTVALVATPTTTVWSHTDTPDAPSNLAASTDAQNARIVFTFDGNISPGPARYYEYSIDNGVWGTTWDRRVYVNNPVHGQFYNVRVRSLDSHSHPRDDDNDGIPEEIDFHRSRSSHISLSAGFPPSAAPNLQSATGGNTSIGIFFTAPAVPNETLAGYQYQLNGGDWVTMTGATLISRSYNISGLTNGTNYDVKIRAVNALGDGGPASNQRSATPSTGHQRLPGLGE